MLLNHSHQLLLFEFGIRFTQDFKEGKRQKTAIIKILITSTEWVLTVLGYIRLVC